MTLENTQSLERELSTSLASLKPLCLKRSWIHLPKKGSEIGVGGYGTVHRATLRKRFFGDKTDVAVKKLYTAEDWEQRLRVALALVQELQVWASLQHPNVLPLLGFYLSSKLEEAWLVSPFASQGNVYDYLERRHPPLNERLDLAKDTAKGLDYLHTRNPPICHGDIKALNVLVAFDGHAKLCDFGLSKTTEMEPSTLVTSSLNNGGTVRYWSPELFVPNAQPTLQSDVWAWGCLLLEIVTSRTPYHDIALEGRVIYQISENIPPAILQPGDCPQHVRELLNQCWNREPNERPTMTHALALLIAGTLHFLQDRSRHSSFLSASATNSSSADLDPLERELEEFLVPLRKYEVKPSWFTFPATNARVGAGGYGVVSRATMRQRLFGPEAKVVVKKLKGVGGREKSLRMAIALVRELTVWAGLTHPNILPLIGYYLGLRLEEAWLVSPYLQNGNLNDYLLRMGPTEDVRLRLALDTAQGLQYLHGLDPPLNVLINDDRRAVLCDFGLAKTMESMPSGLTTSTFNQGGSLPYESPELLLGTSLRAQESDVWAWGCLLQETFSGKFPYYWANNPGAIMKWIIEDIPPAVLAELRCPPRVRTLLTRCWQVLPALRPTMAKCVAVLSGGEDQVQEILGAPPDILPVEALKLKRARLIFDETCRIGSGRFGIVYRATLQNPLGSTSEEIVAVKKLVPHVGDTAWAALEKDVPVWATLKHSNVLRFRGFCEDGGDILLVYPYQSAGTLATYLGKGTFTYAQRLELGKGTAEGLLYLHTRDPPICHGGIHPGNVLVSTTGQSLLSDYGVPALVGTTDEVTTAGPEGYYRYDSPEVLAGTSRPTLRSDIWSWGCLFLKIITNRTPYEPVTNIEALREHIHQSALPIVPETLDCPPRAQNIMGHCWKHNPELRPPASELLAIVTGQSFRFEMTASVPVAENVSMLAFSRDGLGLAVALPGSVKIVETSSWEVVKVLSMTSTKAIASSTFSPSGRFFALSDTSHNVQLWDLNSESLCKTFTGQVASVMGIDISSDDTFVASAASNGVIRVWYFGGEEQKPVVLKTDFRDSPSAIAISPECDLVVAGTNRGGVHIWDIKTKSLTTTLPGRNFVAVRFSPDGSWLLGANTGGEVKRWDVPAIRQKKTDVPCSVAHLKDEQAGYSPSISQDNTWTVALSTAEGEVHMIRFGEGEPKPTVIGNVPAAATGRRVSSGPVSNKATGLVVGFARDGGRAIVYKYASWDYAGAYLV